MRLSLLAVTCTVAALGIVGFTQAAQAVDFPVLRCVLNADKSSVVIVATNSSSTPYSCAVSCHIKVAGQSGFKGFNCNAAVGANTAEDVVCDVKGDGPNYFAEARPDEYICQKR